MLEKLVRTGWVLGLCVGLFFVPKGVMRLLEGLGVIDGGVGPILRNAVRVPPWIAAGILLLVEAVATGAILVRWQSRRGTVVRPPAWLLFSILRFFYSKQTVDEIFVQPIADMRIWHAIAKAEGRHVLAVWVLIRGYWAVWTVVWAHGGATLVKAIVRIWKVV
jgi:hypothetical protein